MQQRIFDSIYTMILAGVFILVCCAQVFEVSYAAIHTSCNRIQARQSRLPSGFVPADGTIIETTTGLPARIVHRASGTVLVLIPAGEFLMGSPAGEPDRSSSERRHRRIIRRPFYLGETEVTVGQFRKFVNATRYQTDAERGTPEAEHGKGAFSSTPGGNREWSSAASWQNPFTYLRDYRLQDNHPVVQVSWDDAQRFCEHFGFQLPTEAQWEYACRAGSRDRFFWGDYPAGGKGYGNVYDMTYKKRFAAGDGEFPFDDGVALLSVVASYKPNAWKLHDMVGNVAEWCLDGYQEYPSDGADESARQGDGSASRVPRGGCWLDLPFLCRSAARPALGQTWRRDFVGFRIAVNLNWLGGIQ